MSNFPKQATPRLTTNALNAVLLIDLFIRVSK